MSGLVGALDLHDRPIDRGAFERAVSCVAYRGSHGIRRWQGPGVAMAFAKFIRTPDAAFDTQPLYDAESGTCVTFDGRLDNREELASQLAIRLSDETCDVALVAAAYAQWGEGCAARFLGDFSFVIWDGRERRLLAARDVMGLRPLFYREWRGSFWWASDQRALVELDIPPINEGYVGEHLSTRITSVDETLYEGIHRLPMAHAMVVRRRGIRRWRYWRPEPERQTRHRDPRDYEAQFRSVLKDAVRVRLRVPGRACLLLSGGIDSSSVGAQIADLRREGHAGASMVTTLSMTIPGSEANEEPLIRRILDRLRLPSELLPARAPTEALLARDAAASLDFPELPNTVMTRPLRDAAAAANAPVLLTGYGGDEWFDSSHGELADLLRRGRLLAAVRWLTETGSASDRVASIQALRLGGWMAVPEGIKPTIRRALRRDPVPPWIDREFARKHQLADRLRRADDDVAFESIAQRDVFQAATAAEPTFRHDHEERVNAALGLEQRHPLMDRRVIEFALALPSGLRCSAGVSKVLMRRAMRDVLPPVVTGMPPKWHYAFLCVRALSALGGVTRVLRAEPVTRGWVRADAMREMYGLMEDGISRHVWPMCAVTGVDFWLRAFEDAREVNHGSQASGIGA